MSVPNLVLLSQNAKLLCTFQVNHPTKCSGGYKGVAMVSAETLSERVRTTMIGSVKSKKSS